MKKLTLTLFIITSILFAISVQAQVGPEQARNYQIDETHTGSINSAGLTPPLRPKWSRNFGQNLSYPLIANGKVYVTVRNAPAFGFGTELYALNASDGATLWSFKDKLARVLETQKSRLGAVSTTCGSGWVNLRSLKSIGISHVDHRPTRYRWWY